MKYIGHLDMMRYFQKQTRRAGIDVSFTEGMSPHMSMSYAFPLGVGMTSDSEYVDVDLSGEYTTCELIRRLNETAAEGIHFLDARRIGITKAEKGMTLVAAAEYTLTFREGHAWDDGWRDDFAEWLEKSEILVMKKGKKGEKQVNIRPAIFRYEIDPPAKLISGTDPEGEFWDEEEAVRNGDLRLLLSAGEKSNVRPELVMGAFAADTGREYSNLTFLINRDEVMADRGTDSEQQLTALIELGDIIA